MKTLKKIMVATMAIGMLCGCSEDTSPEYILDKALTEVETSKNIETTLTIHDTKYTVMRKNQAIYVDQNLMENPSVIFRLAALEPVLDGFYDFEKTVTEDGYDICFSLRESNDALLTKMFQKPSTQGVGILKTTQEMAFVSLEIQSTGGSLLIEKGA